MNSLVKKYGKKKGESIYFGMENSRGKMGQSFKKGVKTASRHGRTVAHLKDYNKLKGKKTAPKGSAYDQAMVDRQSMDGIRSTIAERMGIKKKKKPIKGARGVI